MRAPFKLLLTAVFLCHIMVVINSPVLAQSLSIVGVSASSNDGNVPANTIDNDLATRWSAEGDGQWIEFDLGSVKTINKVLIAFYRGDIRTTQFDIQLSGDRSSWETVYSGTSSGSTLEQESFSIQESQARYVRLVGHGNSANGWNSITEVDINNDALAPPAEFAMVGAPTGDDPPPPPPGDTGTTTSLSKGSITWNFSGSVEYGQFANGDYYVVCPAGCTINSISPAWTGSGNGSMLNPVPGGSQGFHTSAPAYSANLNIATSLPHTIVAGDILISTTSRTPGSNKSYVNEAAILTVVDSAPPAGSFRPGYCDTNRKLYNINALNYSLLKKLPPVSSAPSLASVADLFARPWTGEHLAGYIKRYIHPANNMPDYGREIARDIGIGALTLQLNYTNEEKQQLLINYVQLGIDLYSIIKSGETTIWPANGGHASGRKWPILFAGLVLDEADMKNIGQKSGDYALTGAYGNPPADYINFGEDDQTFYVTQNDVDITNGPSWNPDTRGGTKSYNSSLIGMPEWGIRHIYSPERSDAAWDATYRQCCTATAWSGFVLAARIMDAKGLWNHDALFDYQDRWMAITNGKPDPFGYTVSGEVSGWRTMTTFTQEMWDTYRSQY